MNIRNELSLTRNKTSRGHTLSLWTVMLIICGLALNAWGIVSNGVVTMANNGVMPVLMGNDKLFVELVDSDRPNHRIVNQGQFMFDRDRMHDDGRLLLLADRFIINFSDVRKSIPSGNVGDIINWWGRWLDYPLEGGGNVVSIGDLMRWSGTLCFLLLLPVLIILIGRHLLSGDLPRCFRKQ